MKQTSILFTVFILLMVFAFRAAESIIEQLGMQHLRAQSYILGNIVADFSEASFSEDGQDDSSNPLSIDNQLKHFQIPHASLLAAVINGDQSAAAQAFCQYIKDYVNSQEFASAYQARREAAKPTSEPYRLSAAELTVLKKQLKESEIQIAQAKKSGMLSEAQVAQVSKAISSQEAFIAGQSDPTPNNTRWLTSYPEDPAVAV